MSHFPPYTEQRTLRATVTCALCVCAGLLLAMASIYLGTGRLDGFKDWDLHRLGDRFVRSLIWSLPTAAVAGIVLYEYYRLALAERCKGLLGLIGVVRVFVLFPLFGFLLLLGFIFTLTLGLLSLLGKKLLGTPTIPDNTFERISGPALWFLILPFTLLKMESEGDMKIPFHVSRQRLLRWLPALLILLAFGCGAESESSGERISPHLLTALASYWLGDYLIAAFYVSPMLGMRHRRDHAE